MAGIAISYRREDTGWITGRIFDRLKNHYDGSTRKNYKQQSVVFLDYDATPLGVDFREYIRNVLDTCNILVAVIGPHWMGDDGKGNLRIQHDDDWVRIEIETALKKNIPVIPVLIDRTPFPAKESLPQGIRDLIYRQAAVIDTQIDFDSHIDRLTRQIDRLLGEPATGRKKWISRRAAIAYAVTFISVCVTGILAWLLLNKRFPEPAYTVYTSPELGVTVIYPNNILTLDTTERQQRRLSLRDQEGRPLVRVLRTALPDHKDVKVGRQQEADELRRMDYTLTYVAPENENNWSNWYVISGIKHGTEFYFRRWFSDDSVVSLEFIYAKELAPLFDKLIPRMTHEFSFSSTSPKS
jgi:TIR domain-containing protein